MFKLNLKKILERKLLETEIDLLEQQEKLESARNSVNMYQERRNRLRNELRQIEEREKGNVQQEINFSEEFKNVRKDVMRKVFTIN